MKITNLSITGILLILLFGCRSQTTNSDVTVATPVTVQDLKPGAIEQIVSTTGTAEATNKATLSTQIDGAYYLQKNPRTGKLFRLGDRVKKGELIVKQEDHEYLNGISLNEKEMDLTIAKQEYKQQQSLFSKGGVTQSDLNSAQLSLLTAKNSYEQAQIQLEAMNVIAPFEGAITDLPYYTQGVKVASGTEVVTLMSYQRLHMEVSLPEKYINQVRQGMTIRAMNYTLPNDTLSGEITEISPAISSETRTFTVKLVVNNPDQKLRPGMFLAIDIVVNHVDNVIVVPKDVIISGQRGKSVFVVEKGTAVERSVTLGYTNKDMVEILSGLKANERLVIKGFETLRNRSKVKIVK